MKSQLTKYTMEHQPEINAGLPVVGNRTIHKREQMNAKREAKCAARGEKIHNLSAKVEAEEIVSREEKLSTPYYQKRGVILRRVFRQRIAPKFNN